MVGELHRLHARHVEAHADALEARLAVARPRFPPLESALLPRLRELERLLDVARAGEERRRRRAERLGKLSHSDLVEIAVVDPDALAIAHDQLVHGLRIGPAEPSGSQQYEAALGLLHRLAGAVGDLLVEVGADRLGALQEAAEALDRSRLSRSTEK